MFKIDRTIYLNCESSKQFLIQNIFLACYGLLTLEQSRIKVLTGRKQVKTYPKHFVKKFLFAHPIEFARPIYFDKLAFKIQENIMILLAPIYF